MVNDRIEDVNLFWLDKVNINKNVNIYKTNTQEIGWFFIWQVVEVQRRISFAFVARWIGQLFVEQQDMLINIVFFITF